MKLDTRCIFSETRPPQWVDAWPRYGSVGVMRFSQGYNNALPSLGTKTRVNTSLHLLTRALIH